MAEYEISSVRESVRCALIRLCDGEPSKAAFARKCGTTQPNVQNWINGTSMPTVEKLVEIADIYGLSLDSFVGRDELPSGLTEDEAEVVGLMRKMNAHGGKMLITVAQAFVDSGSYDS